jgi:hypothetical protein
MTQKPSELPWTKREIIDAVFRFYAPPDVKDDQSWGFIILIKAFTILALGRPEGRAAPYIEHALWQRLRRVYTALRDRRDPSAAYETPLDDEEPLTADDQLDTMASLSGREMARIVDEMDRELRAKKKKK